MVQGVGTEILIITYGWSMWCVKKVVFVLCVAFVLCVTPAHWKGAVMLLGEVVVVVVMRVCIVP